jgi:hypothetical protein
MQNVSEYYLGAAPHACEMRTTPVDVDCPYCEKVVRTEVRIIDSDDQE